MSFEESESYLFSLGNEVEAMKLGLGNVRTLLAALGDPHEKYLKVQVAGTNGKGSVCAFLDSICRDAGVSTGLYTSPHLISITERVKINGADIPESDFARISTHVRETAEKLLANSSIEYRPTFFEQVTAIALLAFAETNVDMAILETGLGGRLDATTAANAEIAAITRIDLDHQEYLGDSIEEIAAEKAAIIHAGSRVVVGEQVREAMKMIHARCKELDIEPQASAADSLLEIPTSFPHLGLAGRHQAENAKTAFLVAETLKAYFPITNENIINGLENACHPGRLEVHGQFLFDGAHNVGGARALRAYLDEFITGPITLVFGAMREKQIADISEILFPTADKLVLTRPANSRSLTAEEIFPFVPSDFERSNAILTETVEQAIDKAIAVTPENGLIVVTGSLYLVGEAKKILNN